MASVARQTRAGSCEWNRDRRSAAMGGRSAWARADGDEDQSARCVPCPHGRRAAVAVPPPACAAGRDPVDSCGELARSAKAYIPGFRAVNACDANRNPGRAPLLAAMRERDDRCPRAWSAPSNACCRHAGSALPIVSVKRQPTLLGCKETLHERLSLVSARPLEALSVFGRSGR